MRLSKRSTPPPFGACLAPPGGVLLVFLVSVTALAAPADVPPALQDMPRPAPPEALKANGPALMKLSDEENALAKSLRELLEARQCLQEGCDVRPPGGGHWGMTPLTGDPTLAPGAGTWTIVEPPPGARVHVDGRCLLVRYPTADRFGYVPLVVLKPTRRPGLGDPQPAGWHATAWGLMVVTGQVGFTSGDLGPACKQPRRRHRRAIKHDLQSPRATR